MEAKTTPQIDELANDLVRIKFEKEQLDQEEREIKDILKEKIKPGQTVHTNYGHTIVVSIPGTRTSLKSVLVREKYPEVYKECSIASTVASTIRVLPAESEA